MTEEQIIAIKCAYLDLIGSYDAYQNGNINDHDWDAHELSIKDLEYAFNFLEKMEELPINHPKVEEIINTLRDEVIADGETMEYILRSLGMAHQVYKQLALDESIRQLEK